MTNNSELNREFQLDLHQKMQDYQDKFEFLSVGIHLQLSYFSQNKTAFF